MTQLPDPVNRTPSQSQAIVGATRKSLVRKIADRFSVQPNKLMETLKRTAFRQRDDAPVSNEQMMALLVVADQYQLNPFTREIYAFPDKAGIIPIVGIDGWSRIINSHEQYNGIKFLASENIIQIPEAKAAPEWIECIIYRKDREYPTVIREYLDEVYRPPYRQGMQGPWQTHTKRLLRHKAIIQAARIAFGFAGIYDQDEGERILEGEFVSDADDTSQSAADLNASVNASRQKPQGDSTPDTAPDDASGSSPISAEQIMHTVHNADGLDVLDECEDLANVFDKRSKKHRDIKLAIEAKRAELTIDVKNEEG